MSRDMALANVMRTLRAEQGISQLALANAMGASSTAYLSKLENGGRMNPSRSLLRRYIAAFALLGRALTSEQIAALTAAVFPLAEVA